MRICISGNFYDIANTFEYLVPDKFRRNYVLFFACMKDIKSGNEGKRRVEKERKLEFILYVQNDL